MWKRLKQLLASLLVLLGLVLAAYVFTAYRFHRDHFEARLHRLTLTGLFLEDNQRNRETVRWFWPALLVFGDGSNLYWTGENDRILEAVRIVGPKTLSSLRRNPEPIEEQLRKDKERTRTLLNSLQNEESDEAAPTR